MLIQDFDREAVLKNIGEYSKDDSVNSEKIKNLVGQLSHDFKNVGFLNLFQTAAVLSAFESKIKGANILEIGCGTDNCGSDNKKYEAMPYPPGTAKTLESLGANVTGLDFRPNYEKTNYNHVVLDVFNPDMPTLEKLKETNYDLIVAVGLANCGLQKDGKRVYETLPENQIEITKIFDLFKTEGQIIITDLELAGLNKSIDINYGLSNIQLYITP